MESKPAVGVRPFAPTRAARHHLLFAPFFLALARPPMAAISLRLAGVRAAARAVPPKLCIVIGLQIVFCLIRRAIEKDGTAPIACKQASIVIGFLA